MIFTHNRDEQISRQQSSKHLAPVLINKKVVWMPKDAVSDGTWIASDGQKVGIILNGFDECHVKKTYKASRGSIIPAFFEAYDTDKFIAVFDPSGYEPFTLVLYEGRKKMILYGWDEQNKHIDVLDLDKAVIFSSSTLYSKSVKYCRSQMFSKFVSQQPDENEIWQLHSIEGADHKKFLNVKYNEQIKTVAISQIVLGDEAIFHYKSLTDNLGIKSICL
ncbi:MAG: NRDE family protein [Saprospiraceae bacterium]|nr:NRDE family protein [Saprospiraceae bacterium]